MSQAIGLEPVDSVEILTLCENLIDSMAPSSEVVERRRTSRSNPLVSKLFIKEMASPFQGAHGLSMLVRVARGDLSRAVLYDAGGSSGGLIHNLDCLEVNPSDFSCIVLSHGHFDHILGLIGLHERLGRLALPLTLHPEAFTDRGLMTPSGQITPIGAPSRQGLRDAGLELLEDAMPSLLLEKMILVTGQIPRNNDYETGWPEHMALRDETWEPDPEICDDQALVINVKEKGLVVLSGCGHAGIMNTVRYAQTLTGISQVYAVIGGFHLGRGSFLERIPAFVTDLVELNPAIVAPSHCTGIQASYSVYEALPDSYVHNSVGTQIKISATDQL